MTGRIEVAASTGPIRVRVSASEPVRVSVGAVPVRLRVLGAPGPEGKPGTPGTPGLQGPAGSPGGLEDGIVVDGGNF